MDDDTLARNIAEFEAQTTLREAPAAANGNESATEEAEPQVDDTPPAPEPVADDWDELTALVTTYDNLATLIELCRTLAVAGQPVGAEQTAEALGTLQVAAGGIKAELELLDLQLKAGIARQMYALERTKIEFDGFRVYWRKPGKRVTYKAALDTILPGLPKKWAKIIAQFRSETATAGTWIVSRK